MTQFLVAAHALIERDGLFLLTRRCRAKSYKPLVWDLPGGKVKVGESPEEGMAREVKEETGLEVAIDKILDIYTNLDDMPNNQYFAVIYQCHYASGEVKLNHEEHDEFRWVTAEELESLETIHYLKTLAEKSLVS